MMGLTHEQRRALSVISDHNARGESPSYDEIRAALGLASKSGVARLVTALEERGAIRRLPGRPRALEAVDPIASMSTSDLRAMRARIDRVLAGRAQ